VETGRPDEPYKAEGISHAGDDLAELVEVVGVLLELGQLLDLGVDVLRVLVGVEAGVVLLGAVLLELLAVATQHVLDVLHEEELAEGRHLPE
jgi:hypothetical protein